MPIGASIAMILSLFVALTITPYLVFIFLYWGSKFWDCMRSVHKDFNVFHKSWSFKAFEYSARSFNTVKAENSYAELFFRDTLWPDFSSKELEKIIKEFKKIEENQASELENQAREEYTSSTGITYTIKVIQVPSEFTRAPLRQAIAELPNGVKRFESSKSYSAGVEVLKQEVKFRIDNSQV
jgi:multidrug efflux pump subunit AcrB